VTHTMTAIFIRGFEYDTDEDTLKTHFGKVGKIDDLYFQSNGSAVISYKTAAVANRAVEELDGTTIKGQQRYVSVKLDDADRESKGKGKGKEKGKGGKGKGKSSNSYSDVATVFINGFEYDTDEAAVKRHFGKAGKIVDLYFQSKGSAVIVFESAAAAGRAVAEIDGTTMKGQERYVSVKLDDPDRQKGEGKGKGKSKKGGSGSGGSGNSVYASGFDFSTDEAVLKKHFSTVGEIRDLYFQSKGSAVISYKDAETAEQAVAELDGSTIKGQERYVAVHIDVRSSGGKGKSW